MIVILAYVRLIVNPSDGIIFDRIVNFPVRGIGKTTLEKIHKLSNDNDYTYLRVLGELDMLSIGKKQKEARHKFNQLSQKYRMAYKDQGASFITRGLIADIDLQNYYENQNTQEALDRWGNVQELLNSITVFQDNRDENSLSEFLE